MISRQFYVWLKIISVVFAFSNITSAQHAPEDTRAMVAMRMIGHQVLLSMGDSTSQILPIEKDSIGYRIKFENDFAFDPENLVNIITEVVEQANVTTSYYVSIEDCLTKQQVYSFAVGLTNAVDLIPCKGRLQPLGCYEILFSIASENEIESLLTVSNIYTNEAIGEQTAQQSGMPFNFYLIIGVVLLFAALLLFKKLKTFNKHLIKIGDVRFDTKNLILSIDGQKIELTSKESDLLLLLYNSVNHTVERDVILNAVWADEGDYIGRTLDVFISKLRKKLMADAKIKIVNVRGVGYKLIVNNS